MHPSGVQFGLSRGLLQLRGEEVLLSDQLLEAISLEAQLHLHLGRPPIQGNVLVDITVRAAQNALGNDQGARRQEIVPFFVGLNRKPRRMPLLPCPLTTARPPKAARPLGPLQINLVVSAADGKYRTLPVGGATITAFYDHAPGSVEERIVIDQSSVTAAGGNVGLVDGSVAWRKINQMNIYRGSQQWDANGCWAMW